MVSSDITHKRGWTHYLELNTLYQALSAFLTANGVESIDWLLLPTAKARKKKKFSDIKTQLQIKTTAFIRK